MKIGTGVVAHGTARGSGPHEQEAGRAQLLVGALGLQPVAAVGAVVGLVLLVVVVVVLGGDETVLEDAIEIGLDVVGREQLVVLVLLLLAGDARRVRVVGRLPVVVGLVVLLVLGLLGGLVVVLVDLDEDVLVVELVGVGLLGFAVEVAGSSSSSSASGSVGISSSSSAAMSCSLAHLVVPPRTTDLGDSRAEPTRTFPQVRERARVTAVTRAG